MSEVLALVLARGGSKGIPNKNIVPFLGKPLLAWSVAAAQEAETVTRIVLSSDSEEIAACGRAAGAEVPFMRPADLAADDTLDHAVFVHALTWLAKEENYRPDLIVHIRPTSPLRPKGLIDRAVRMMQSDSNADSIRVVCEPENNPFKMWRIDGPYMKPLIEIGVPEPYNMPRQRLPQTYWQIGMLDVVRPRTILEMGSMSGQNILPLVVDRSYAVDIDDMASLRRAEEKCRAAGMGEAA